MYPSPMKSSHILQAAALGALLFRDRSRGARRRRRSAGAAGVSGPSERNAGASSSRSTDGFDYVRRDVMIPMRDGVKLHTVILVPKGAKGAPILLTRTPYDATALTSHAQSAHLGPILSGYDNATDVIVEGGYIRVVQDVRGKYGSEGDYVMNRPLRGPQNPTPVDHATDTYDTIDWLVKNVPETQRQGRHPRHLLRRLPAADGARQSASGAQGVGADEPDGRRLDGRRLVPQRRVPPADDALHLRAGGDARERGEVVDEPLRRLRHVHAGGIGRRARTPPRPRAGRLLAEAPRAPDLRRVLARPGGGQDARRRSR